ncbi:hypothetical protein [Photobacterium leiognathi]|uniref:hypothetical protein n=1 Tax=Photobacterium leiognathi TaxID=553611 RepID=UPI00298230D7|nr:hypothetical protein [Photobacterium leiognathi]
MNLLDDSLVPLSINDICRKMDIAIDMEPYVDFLRVKHPYFIGLELRHKGNYIHINIRDKKKPYNERFEISNPNDLYTIIDKVSDLYIDLKTNEQHSQSFKQELKKVFIEILTSKPHLKTLNFHKKYPDFFCKETEESIECSIRFLSDNFHKLNISLEGKEYSLTFNPDKPMLSIMMLIHQVPGDSGRPKVTEYLRSERFFNCLYRNYITNNKEIWSLFALQNISESRIFNCYQHDSFFCFKYNFDDTTLQLQTINHCLDEIFHLIPKVMLHRAIKSSLNYLDGLEQLWPLTFQAVMEIVLKVSTWSPFDILHTVPFKALFNQCNTLLEEFYVAKPINTKLYLTNLRDELIVATKDISLRNLDEFKY